MKKNGIIMIGWAIAIRLFVDVFFRIKVAGAIQNAEASEEKARIMADYVAIAQWPIGLSTALFFLGVIVMLIGIFRNIKEKLAAQQQ